LVYFFVAAVYMSALCELSLHSIQVYNAFPCNAYCAYLPLDVLRRCALQIYTLLTYILPAWMRAVRDGPRYLSNLVDHSIQMLTKPTFMLIFIHGFRAREELYCTCLQQTDLCDDLVCVLLRLKCFAFTNARSIFSHFVIIL